jgi:hypothetical protein
MFANPSAAEVLSAADGPAPGPEETGMEQLDPEDGLAVWDFTEDSSCPVRTSPSSAWVSGAVRDLARLEPRPSPCAAAAGY